MQRTESPPSVDCSVLVPVYNEKASLSQLLIEIEAAFEEVGRSFEVIVVDDGSTDGTWKELAALAADHPALRAIRLRRNFGKSAALDVGADHARGAIIITLDGDLQDDPGEIPRFLEALGDEPRLVAGWKVDRQDPSSKRLPSKVFNAVTSFVSGVKLHDHNCGFKAGPAELFQAIPLYGELHRFIPAMASDLGYDVVELDVHHRPRRHGKSKFGFERYARGFLDLLTVMMITRYRRRPGHLLGGIGVLLGLIGAAILSYLAVVWFVSDEAVGTRPLLALGVLACVVSVQLVSFGIIAELIVNRSEIRDHQQLAAEEIAGAG